MLTSAAFDFPAQMPDNVRYVGAVLDDPAWAGGSGPIVGECPAPAGTEPFVLVAMSSTFQDQGDSLRHVVDALGTLPVRALVTTGPTIDPATIEHASNVEVVAAAPHSQLLPHASVVVTHAGHGTVIKSLAAGVPLVVMPHGRDQADNAARVVARHAGVNVSRSAKPKAIAAAISKVLGDATFAENASRLGQTIRDDAASGALVREFEDLPVNANPA